MLNIGGNALSNGIRFLGDKKIVTAVRKKDGNIDIKIEDNIIYKNWLLKWLDSFVYKIPILRGVFDLFTNVKFIFLYFLIVILSQAIEFLNKNNTTNSYNNYYNIIEITFIIALVVITTYQLIYIIKEFSRFRMIRVYHGAEHKAIETYNKGELLTIENIRNTSRVSSGCGTNIVTFWMVIGIIFDLFIQDLLHMKFILSFSLAYELFRIKNGEDKFFISLFYKFSFFIQDKLLTKEPDDSQIQLAIEGLNVLIEEESKMNNEAISNLQE